MSLQSAGKIFRRLRGNKKNCPGIFAMQDGLTTHQMVACAVDDSVHIYDQNVLPSECVLALIKKYNVVYHPFVDADNNMFYTEVYRDNWCSYFSNAFLDQNIRPESDGSLSQESIDKLNKNFKPMYRSI